MKPIKKIIIVSLLVVSAHTSFGMDDEGNARRLPAIFHDDAIPAAPPAPPLEDMFARDPHPDPFWENPFRERPENDNEEIPVFDEAGIPFEEEVPFVEEAWDELPGLDMFGAAGELPNELPEFVPVPMGIRIQLRGAWANQRRLAGHFAGLVIGVRAVADPFEDEEDEVD